MRAWRKQSKLTFVVAAVACFATTGGSTAVAQENTNPGQATALASGGGVFLDGIRALDVEEDGERDEVYILHDGVKIWPTTAAYVSIAAGQRVEVDKCVPVGATLRLWDDDGALNPNDFLGLVKILTETTGDHYFDGVSSRYRLGVVA